MNTDEVEIMRQLSVGCRPVQNLMGQDVFIITETKWHDSIVNGEPWFSETVSKPQAF